MNAEQIRAAKADADAMLNAAIEKHKAMDERLRREAGKLLRAARGDKSLDRAGAVLGYRYQTMSEMEGNAKHSRYSMEKILDAAEALASFDWSILPQVRTRGYTKRKKPNTVTNA